MHICIPDTREVRPPQGNAYLLYNIHIDGLYHCSLRYKQLLQLHQSLTKYFNAFNQAAHNRQQVSLPQFPPKKLLPLSVAQTEERRQQLEKYLQNISQDKAISNSTIFNLFLLEAQRESTRIKPNQVHLDIELVNGQKIKLQIVTHDSADSILTAVCRALNLKDRYHAYFCLCLCGYDVVRDKLIIKRRLSFFESPYITLQMAIQQQEQLQNVLVSTANSCVNGSCNSNCNTNVNTSISSTNSGGSNGYSSMTSQSSGGSSCRCLSCSTRNLHIQHQQQQQTNLTDVPSLCSSSGSYNVNNNTSLYNIDNNSNGENYNNIDPSHYNHNNNNNNNNNNTLNNNDSTLTTRNDNTISSNNKSNNNHSHQSYYTDNSNNNNNWLTPSSSAATSSRSFVTHRILLRKSYWDPIYDTYILNDQQALNLLFIQTVYDMKHSLMFVDRETYHRLETLLAADQKLEYILLARTLKYYNHVHFEPCYSDYPRPRTKVMISIGSRELNMRVLKSPKSIISSTSNRNNNNQRHQSSLAAASTSGSEQQSATNPNLALESPAANEPILYCTSSLVPNGYHHLITKSDLIEEEYSFKVPLIRCWRLTSLETLNNNNPSSSQTGGSIFGHRSTSSAATTFAGGKRKSLSLFNGVIGNATNSNNDDNNNNINNNSNDRSNRKNREANIQHHRLSSHQEPPHLNNQFNTTSGSNGRSLLAAMANLVDTGNAGSNGNNRNIFDDQYNRCSGDCCNRVDNADANSHRSCNHSAPMTHIDHTQFIQYELSFEYLIAKDTLKWITISSDQAIFISISLQGVVDELVSKRDGLINAPYDSVIDGARGQSHLLPPLNGGNQTSNTRLLQQQQYQNNSFTYMFRDGSQKVLNIDDCQSIERFVSPLANHLPVHQTTSATNIARQRQQQQQQHQQQYQQSQSRASSLFSSFKSSAYGSSSATVRGLIAVLSNNDLAGSSTSGSNISSQPSSGPLYVPSCCGQPSTFEISSFRKEPSPIINDAFEGVMANDEDL